MTSKNDLTNPFKGYNVYSTIPIFGGLPLQVECITGYDDYVLVGTNRGHLLIYKITFNTPVEINLTHSNKYFSKKPIIQLDVIPEHKVLISLTLDNGIAVHDISQFNCPTIFSIERTKEASSFYLDIVRQTSLTGDLSITVRLCSVVGKRLQFFYWKNRNFHELREDLTVSENPRAISWCKETLCIALKSDYQLLNLLTGVSEELFSIGKHGEPIIARISTDTFALAQDKKTILIYTDRTREMQVVNWNETPTATVFDDPYLLSITAGKGVEIRTINPKVQVDYIPLNGAKNMTCTRSGHVYIASSNSIWCLKATPVKSQIESYLKQSQFELALSLANVPNELTEDKKKTVDHILTLHAFYLFCEKKFDESMAIYTKLEAEPTIVIGFFPDLLPSDFRNRLEYPGEIPELVGIDLERGLAALEQFLVNARRKLLGDAKFKINSLTPVTDINLRSRKQLLQIIDTTLLKCYLQINELLIPSILRLENFCHIEESERALKKHGKLEDIILMYQTKGLHRKAIELLLRQKNSDKVIEYLQNLGKEELDLILEFSKPLLLENPNGLRIFIQDLHEIECLPRPRVYDFLLNHSPELVIPYLEHIINVWMEKNTIFHNALINQYREKICNLANNSGELDPNKKIILAETREKLFAFLKSSIYYTPEHVLVHFPYSDMHEERAMLLERLGRHEQALSIYIIKMKDLNKAIDYSIKVYEKNEASGKEVFTILLNMLLSSSLTSVSDVVLDKNDKSTNPDISGALKLLQEYAPCIEAFKALKYLPDNIEIRLIDNFLRTSFQNHFSERRKLVILKGLFKSDFLRTSIEKLMNESFLFKVNESTICDVCQKKFTNQSALARSIDGSIVHFSCQEKD